MQSLLSLPSRILITIVALATVVVGAMTMNRTPSSLAVGGVFFFFVLAFTASLWAGRWAVPLLRVCAAIVPLAYLAYFIDTFVKAWPNLSTPASPGQSHWMNALGGLLIFGVPCAIFAVRGWGKEEVGPDPEAPSDGYVDDDDEDQDVDDVAEDGDREAGEGPQSSSQSRR